MSFKKVVVSHSGKQYVHQLLYALQKQELLYLFLTSIWYKPSLLSYKILLGIPVVGKVIFQKFLRKKTYPEQRDDIIVQFPWKEFARQLLVQASTKYRSEKYVLEVEKSHDKFVANYLTKIKADIFIGYEKSSLKSFEVIKEQGGITVLDLAQVHYKYLIQLRDTQEIFKDLFEDKILFDEINRIKEAEYALADYILTLSEFAKSTLVTFGIDERKIKVVSLGYNPAVFKPKKLTSNSESLPLKLIYTGTFTKRKGIHLLLQALSELGKADIQLTIIGPVLDGQELFDQYKGLFTYYDFLHHEELVGHLHASDVYVFPSYLDSWAMTVIEAMACGLPVIVTENTGAKDAVTNGESGYILPVGDKEALKNAILHFYETRSEMVRMGVAAIKAAEMYKWDNYYKQVSEFICSIKTENR